MNIKKNLKYGFSALALALVLSSCSQDKVKDAKNDAKDIASNAESMVSEQVESTKDKIEDKKQEKAKEKNAEAMVKGIENKEFKISLDDAIKKFKDTFTENGIEVEAVEFGEDDGKYGYKIQGFKGNKEYELSLDADSGEVLSQESDTDEDSQNDMAIDFSKIIKPEDAIKKAKENNKGYVESWDLDYDNGKLVYEVDVQDGDDVQLDASTGDIIKK